jgi:membrane fusion protein, copper/silver efflux system
VTTGLLVFVCLAFSAVAADPHAGHGSPSPKPSQQASPKDEVEQRVPIEVPSAQQARAGLRVERVAKKAVQHRIRSVGNIAADQRREAHVHTKINGWIERVQADYVGKPVKKGQALFELYSPDLVSTQEEYLSARRQGAGDIARAALDRLRLWGVPERELRRLRESSRASRTMSFESPVDGIVVNKTAIQGMYVTPEMELYHIADLSKVWVIVTLYEHDLAAVKEGDPASIELPYDPEKRLSGKIDYIYPEVDAQTRTARARIELANPDRALKPGMFANVTLEKRLGPSITVPDNAVIDTGKRRIVFVKTSPTRFEPREVTVGPRVGAEFVIFRGLKEGEEVVTGANFLLDAESKLQAAAQRGEQSPAGHAGH